jgi:hypothetical protein
MDTGTAAASSAQASRAPPQSARQPLSRPPHGWSDHKVRYGIVCDPGSMIKGDDGLMHVCQQAPWQTPRDGGGAKAVSVVGRLNGGDPKRGTSVATGPSSGWQPCCFGSAA